MYKNSILFPNPISFCFIELFKFVDNEQRLIRRHLVGLVTICDKFWKKPHCSEKRFSSIINFQELVAW